MSLASYALHPVEPAGVSVWEFGLRLVLATCSGAIIGWERELKQRPAGLRTHMLVALGACLFTLIALDLQAHGSSAGERAIDPTRVIEGIVGGVGFLGAGAILHSKQTIRGMTTAAGIWVVAAIGVTAATANYAALAIVIALAWTTLAVLSRFERRTKERFRSGAGR